MCNRRVQRIAFERLEQSPRRFRMANPFGYFKASPEMICMAVMMYVRLQLSLRNVEDLLYERGVEISH